MIKKTAILFIRFYQMFISSLLKNLLGVSAMCRFPETCSQYAKRMISEQGLRRGFWLSLVRLAKCQPYGNL